MNRTHFAEPVSTFAFAPQPGNACLAATEHGLWQFTASNGGWQQVAPQFAQIPLTSVAACGPTWLVGSNGDIAFSRDGGRNWQLAVLPVRAHILALALSPAFEQDGIALAATAQDGVLRSADGGVTWHAWNYGLLDLGVNALAVSPRFSDDATCFAASDDAVFISINGGRAWHELPMPAACGPFTSLAIVERGDGLMLFAGTEGHGLWSAAEPFERWQPSTGLRAQEINYLWPEPLTAATTRGIYAANGKRWTKRAEYAEAVCLASLDDGTLIVGTAGSGVWHIG